MLWYLLYPIRGTAQPPRLSANHPVRRAFYRHGKTTAQHWLLAMLVSVAIAMGFSYPTVLHSENPTAGLISLPHHVWTTAKLYDGNPEDADIEMRQVWIHGSYMRALEKDVLKSALKIQHTLLGDDMLGSISPRLDGKLRSSELAWAYHSPLMYWNNSESAIASDHDVLHTINEQASATSSSLNLALRPASVFAGKRFDHRKLTAADALVITLVNKVNNNVGAKWQDRMTWLARGSCPGCTLFPTDAQIARTRMYEFSFTPLTARENLALTSAYSCMAIYVLLCLRRLKAFHSRFGLFVTAITQMTCSILASFTICGILKINLSMIPQSAYPFVVLVMGIENMFRIINGVLAYQPTMATELRIANALGDVGPVSVATAVQNLVLLSLLSRVVSPGVAAFCAFACISTLFDTFFLLTFFVAVLNVDIRRFELQDALARANRSRPRRKPSPIQQHTWFDALVHGRLPFSTRMAGTAVTTTFILSLNYHFFEHTENATGLRDLFRLVKDGPPTQFDTFAPPPINASLTPDEWMRMQDFDTTREVMRLANPGADSFVIRIFAPLIIVLAHADRNDLDADKAWTTALRSFAIHHFYPVAVAVVFAVAFVAVLMNFLLYTEHADEGFDVDMEEKDALKVQTVRLPHKLDIMRIAGTEAGHFGTVALDRTVAICLFDRSQQTHRILSIGNEALSRIHWPIHTIALDDAGEFLACHCADEDVLLYRVSAGTMLSSRASYPDDSPCSIFRFVRLPCSETSKLHLVVLTSSSQLTTLDVDSGKSSCIELTQVPVLGARLIEPSAQEKRLVVVTADANFLSCLWKDNDWVQVASNHLPLPTLNGRVTGAAQIERYTENGHQLFIVTTGTFAILLDEPTLAHIATLRADQHAKSLNSVMLGQAGTCTSCGSLAFRQMALVQNALHDPACVVRTIEAAQGDDGAICLRNSTTQCHSIDKALVTPVSMSNAGAWSVVGTHAMLGLRKQVRHSQLNSETRNGFATALRRRQRRQVRSSAESDEGEDSWEAYKLTVEGDLETADLSAMDVCHGERGTDLYVSTAGPVALLNGQSIAVAFGNTVKLIRSVRRGSTSRRSTGRSFERQPVTTQNGSAPDKKH